MLEHFFSVEDAVSCRSCGATHAAPVTKSPNRWELCLKCHSRAKGFEAEIDQDPGSDVSEPALILFLANELALAIKNMEKGLPCGRCEATSNNFYSKFGGKNQYIGYQCGGRASKTTEGRKVCKSHFNSPKIKFACDSVTNEYPLIEWKIRQISAHDERFRDAVVRAVSSTPSSTG